MRRAFFGLFVLLVLGAAALAVATVPRHRVTFHAPVFTPDGRSIVAVRRDLHAWVLGPGLEMLTPPARVYVRRDRFRIVRIDRQSGRETVIEDLPPSPLEGRSVAAYRVHLAWLGQARAAIEWNGATPEWRVAITLREDASERTSVVASGERPARWRQGGGSIGSGDERATLSGSEEVLVLPAQPCAVVLLDEAHGTVRTVDATGGCGAGTQALDIAAVLPYARRASIERTTRIETLRADLVRQGRAAGLTDVDAELHALDALEREGYLPRPPQLVATPLPPGDVQRRRESGTLTPLFAISPMEFRVGLFPDIQAALASPGAEVPFQGPYLVHRDFATSQSINSYLAGGGHAFFVETAAGTASIRLVPRREATR